MFKLKNKKIKISVMRLLHSWMFFYPGLKELAALTEIPDNPIFLGCKFEIILLTCHQNIFQYKVSSKILNFTAFRHARQTKIQGLFKD